MDYGIEVEKAIPNVKLALRIVNDALRAVERGKPVLWHGEEVIGWEDLLARFTADEVAASGRVGDVYLAEFRESVGEVLVWTINFGPYLLHRGTGRVQRCSKHHLLREYWAMFIRDLLGTLYAETETRKKEVL